tara:strand:- start:356 stop:1717 length:1362 start_codon:yes stop_codon:yes gene_type:complete
MKIKLYRSSTVGIINDNFKLLTDPWLVDGEYYGSWSHYPKFEIINNLDEINSYDAIYISHIHPDHFSTKTLKHINKKIPVYISSYHSKFLKFNIEKLGFKAIELSNGKRHKLKNNFFLTIYPADDCDPELCYKFNGCAMLDGKTNGSQQIDSLSVIDDGKFSILNVNDCPFELAQYPIKTKVLKNFEKIDLLLTGYGGAGPYPQCFDNLNLDQKLLEGKKKEISFLEQAFQFIKTANPSFYLPFAGTYVLSGKLNTLQNLRGIPLLDTTYDYLEKKINSFYNEKKPEAIKLNIDESFCFDTKKYSNQYKKVNLIDLNQYQQNYLNKLKLDYENDAMVEESTLLQNADLAMKKYIIKKNELNIDVKSDIYLKFKDKFIKIPNSKDEIKVVSKKELDNSISFVVYNIDQRLLNRLLEGPKFAHWNNAEIGSHINFFRNPNIFERNLYYSMNFFHK